MIIERLDNNVCLDDCVYRPGFVQPTCKSCNIPLIPTEFDNGVCDGCNETLSQDDRPVCNVSHEQETEQDEVNNPSHYTSGLYETIDEMLVLFGVDETMSFCKLNAWKYRSRCGLKKGQDAAKDRAKSDWYIDKYNQLARYRSATNTGPFNYTAFLGIKPKNIDDIFIEK